MWGGPLKGGPYDEDVIERYVDAFRILKTGGELRTNLPFLYSGGVAEYLYFLAEQNLIEITPEAISDYKTSHRGELALETNEKGIPLSRDFLNYFILFFPKQDQKGIWEAISDDLVETFNENGIRAAVELIEVDKNSNKFAPFMKAVKL